MDKFFYFYFCQPMKHRTRVPEYAKANSMSPMQVRNLIHQGILPAIVINRLILIDPDEADRALERFHRGPKLSVSAAKGTARMDLSQAVSAK
jgi:hypothetical protein